MWESLKQLISPTQYIPHGHCYLWQTNLVWLHILSDLAIAIAYFSIPAMLIYFVYKRKDVPFLGIFGLFGAFIILCGTGHLMEIWTLWHPAYWLTGIEKAMTALVSCYTALTMVTLLPQFLSLKTPEQLEAINRELQKQIIERQQAEQILQSILEGTASVTGEEFFPALVQNLATALDVRHVFVAEVSSNQNQRLKTLAFWAGNRVADNFEYSAIDTPCQPVLEQAKLCYYPNRVQELFPKALGLKKMEAVCYLGVPLLDGQQQVIGALCINNDSPISNEENALAIMQVFAARAAAELQRQKAENALRRAYDELEIRVDEATQGLRQRTAELVKLNAALLTEIKERIAAEAALRTSEARFQRLVANVPGVIYQFRLNSDGSRSFPYFSSGCREVYETEAETIVQNPEIPFRQIHPDDFPGLEKSIGISAATMQPWQYKWRQTMPSGKVKWLQGASRPEQQADGNILWDGVIIDITELKQTEAQLRQSEARNRALLNAIPDMMFRCSSDGTYIDFKPAKDIKTFVPPSAFIGKKVHEFLPPELAEKVLQAHERSIKTSETQIIEYQLPIDNQLRDYEARIVACGSDEIIAIVRDITDRKQAQEALQESKERFRNLVEVSSDWVWEVNEKGVYTYASPKIRDLLGYEPEEVLGKTPFDMMPKEEAARVANIFGSIAAQAKPFACVENTNLHKDGYLVVLETNAVPLFDSNGKFRGYRGVDRDITSRKQAEIVLRQQSAAMAVATDGIGILDSEGKYIYVNDAYLRIFGYENAADRLGKSWHSLYEEAELQRFDRELIPVLERTGNCRTEAIGKRKDGSTFPVEIAVTKLEEGGSICIVRDISDRKQALEALRESEERFRIIFENIAIGISLVSPDGRFLKINPGHSKIFGYSESELKTRTFIDITHPDDIENDIELRRQLLAGKIPYFSMEKRFIRKDGEFIWINLTVSLVRLPSGDPKYMLGVIEDISDRKRAVQELRNSEQRWQLVLKGNNDGIWDLDLKTNKVFRSARYKEILGYQEHELGDDNSDWVSRIHPDDFERVIQANQDYLTQKTPIYAVEYRQRCKDGTYKWVLGRAQAVWDETGNPVRMVGSTADISDRKQAELALQETAERERAIARVIQQMRQTLDLKAIFNTTTQELRQVLNCDRVLVYRFNSDWSGEFVSESMTQGWKALVQEQIRQPQLTEVAVNKDGCVIKTSNSADNLIQDTYLQETQGGVYRQGTSYRCVPDIYKMGFDSCYLELLEQIQARAYIIVPIFCGTQLWGLLATYQNSSSRHWKDAEIRIVAQIGTQLGVAVQQAELFAQTQQQAEQLKVAKEIALSEAARSAAANSAKSEFLANMSHELRTPLNAVLGFTQLMQRDTSLSAKHKQYLEIINRSGEHLLELINDVLEMSKIEAGRVTLNENSFNLHRLLDNLEEMLQPRATSKGLELTFEVADQIPQYLKADESKLRQVLINLLSNAIKFTTNGSVTLRVIMGLGTGEGYSDALLPGREEISSNSLSPFPFPLSPIIFEVSDTGPGIALEEQDKLFKPFNQTETGLKSGQGTGLGLAISQKFVQLMGGELTVNSIPGQGATFAFNIPVTLLKETLIETPQISRKKIVGLAPNQPVYRILIAEDKPTNRLLLVNLLNSFGFEVREATNGQETIALWESWEPHLIWMDMQMPVMNGYEATKYIKSSLKGQATVIIALTASAFEESKQVVLSAGCDDFMRKPFRDEELLAKISQYLGVRFLYEEKPELGSNEGEQQNLSSCKTLQPSSLKVMPKSWIEKLHHAAAQCNDFLIFQLIEEIPQENSSLGVALTELVENFQFELLMELAQSVD